MAIPISPLEKVCSDWIVSNLRQFKVDANWDNTQIFRNLKPFGELVLLAGLNSHIGRGGLRDTTDRVVAWLIKNRPSARRLADMVKEFPQSFPWVCMIWQNYERAGIPDRNLRNEIKKLLTINSVMDFERHVGHDICLHYIVESLGLKSPFDLIELYGRTMLARRAWNQASETSIYYICHDIFFMTNWGKVVLQYPLKPCEAWLSKLQRWYDRCVASGSVDLAAEIVIACAFLRDRKTMTCHLPFASSKGSDLPPHPPGQGDGFITSEDSKDRVQFFRNYHTVVVCLIALGRQNSTARM